MLWDLVFSFLSLSLFSHLLPFLEKDRQKFFTIIGRKYKQSQSTIFELHYEANRIILILPGDTMDSNIRGERAKYAKYNTKHCLKPEFLNIVF